MWKLKCATRLNSFLTRHELFHKNESKKLTPMDLVARAGQVKGLTHIDLNFPDHIQKGQAAKFEKIINEVGLSLNSLAMRYYKLPQFDEGALSHPDNAIRQAAIDLTLAGIETLQQMGGNILTLWLSQEGQEYAFQIDYSKQYAYLVDSLQKIAQSAPEIQISIEYKASEPRGISTIGTAAATLLLINDISSKNIGVTIDFCHSLMAREQPAAAATLVCEKSQLLGIHLNDGYGYKDDGLMIGSVHTLHTLELLWVLKKYSFQGVIYFDTFATYQNPVEECEKNIKMLAQFTEQVESFTQSQSSLYQYSSWQEWLSQR
jgi:xylose isomerase